MAFILFIFNDPLYVAHIYAPSFLTFALTELGTSLFISGTLVFWLRELASFAPRQAPESWGKLKKLVFAC